MKVDREVEKDFQNPDSAFKNFKKNPLKPDKELDYYFASYSNTSIHYDMLRDTVRTQAYRDSMQKCPELFKGKVVLDLGCGTGILSMFAARAGAKKVFGVEMASIYKQAREIVRENGLQDVIEIINGRIEEIELPVPEVDIIISEWMGYLLLYESMFDSVIFARDKYLAKNGMLFPNEAKMYAAGVFDDYDFVNNDKLDNFMGVQLSELKRVTNLIPNVGFVNQNIIITDTATIFTVNLEKCSKAELDFIAAFKLTSQKKSFLNGIVVWFDVLFTHGETPFILSTSPYATGTHWKQSSFYFDRRLPVFHDDVIEARILLRRNKENFRFIDVKLDVDVQNSLGKHKVTQFFLFQ